MSIKGKSIAVAVAVLRYGDEFLLATRHSHQHQGGKLEFVGGKIEQGETAQTALIREVSEELGLDVAGNVMTKLGRIWHDYGDKSVCLHVYQVWLSYAQYIDFKDKKLGLDGQAIGFYGMNVLDNPALFPDANAPILRWLRLPNIITISHELSFFNKQTDWLDCYKKLPQGRTLLMRTCADVKTNMALVHDLHLQRNDIKFVMSWHHDDFCDDLPILAHRLTQKELMALDVSSHELPNAPLIVSCHDELSIYKANTLAKTHPVMAILLSPVKPTATHPDEPALGWENFAKLAKGADVPVIALGGLNMDDVTIAYQYGAVAVAGIRSFIGE